MKAKITKRFLDSLTNDTGKDMYVFDSGLKGFGVKVTRNGHKSFIVNARIKNGPPKRTTLGSYPLFSVAKARDKAEEVLRLYRQGRDPAKLAREEQQRTSQQAAIDKALGVTLRSVFEDFLRARSLKPKTEYDYRNTVKNCLSDWLDKPVRGITRKDVEQRFFTITKKNRRNGRETGKAQAVKAMRILSSIMEYAKAEEIEGQRLIQDNPVKVLQEKKISRTIKPRERYIPEKDLWRVVSVIQSLGNGSVPKNETAETVRDWLLLLLHTGIRKNEGLTLRWENVDLRLKYFIVEDTKNGRDHVVPMSYPVDELLSRRKTSSGDSPWVFPASRGNGHLLDPRHHVAWVAEGSGIPFTAHDLRRTFASVAHACGLDPITIKRVMNHKTRDITERYVQTRADKLRAPMDEIAMYINGAVDHYEREWIEANMGKDHYENHYCA